MESWDHDIERVQEIQQLLENRQQYFSGQWNTIISQTNFKENMRSMKCPSASYSDVSLGQSVEAQLDSLESEDFPLQKNRVRGESKHKMQDNRFHTSHISDKRNTKIKTEKTSKKLSEWVSKNVEQALTPIADKNVIMRDKNTSTQSRRRSVSFRRNSLVAQDPFTNPNDKSEDLRRKSKVKLSNPLDLLKSKSWLLRTEVLNRNPSDKNVLNYITKGTLSHAREKLKNAEKSLQLVINDDVSQPLRRPIINKTMKIQELTKERLNPVKKTVSRLATRQAEEAIKSDLNLREAFALIKINPDPIIQLAAGDSNLIGKSAPGQKLVTNSETIHHQKQDHMKMVPQTQMHAATKPKWKENKLTFPQTGENSITIGKMQTSPLQMRLSLLGVVSKEKDQTSRKNSCVNVHHRAYDCWKGPSKGPQHLYNDRKESKLGNGKHDYTTHGFPIESHYSVDKLAGTVL